MRVKAALNSKQLFFSKGNNVCENINLYYLNNINVCKNNYPIKF